MKAVRIFLYSTMLVTLLILVACTRTYDDGETEEIGWIDATFDIIGGKPSRSPEELLKEKVPTGDVNIDEAIKKFNASIAEKNKKIVKHNIGAQNDKENPDTGMSTLLGLIATACGVGWAKTFLNKRTSEAGRRLAVKGEHISNARYQSIKDGYRDDDTALEKIKFLAKEGEHFAKDNYELIEKSGDDIKIFKAIMATAKKKS